MQNSFTVYAHVAPNHKKYIGITNTSVERRWRNNGIGYANQPYFYKAIQKYGWDKFDHIILSTGLTKTQACELEKLLIGFWNTTDPKFGYNIATGGEGPFGVVRSEATKAKLRLANIGKKHTEETKKKISEHNAHYNKGKKLTPDHIEKLIQSRKGKPAWNKGKKLSDEYKQKLSNSHKGKTPWNKGIPCSKETKQKVSLANTGRISKYKGVPIKEETKAKISETLSGSIWVHNNETKHRSLIKKDQLSEYIKLGYILGKKFD